MVPLGKWVEILSLEPTPIWYPINSSTLSRLRTNYEACQMCIVLSSRNYLSNHHATRPTIGRRFTRTSIHHQTRHRHWPSFLVLNETTKLFQTYVLLPGNEFLHQRHLWIEWIQEVRKRREINVSCEWTVCIVLRVWCTKYGLHNA